MYQGYKRRCFIYTEDLLFMVSVYCRLWIVKVAFANMLETTELRLSSDSFLQ